MDVLTDTAFWADGFDRSQMRQWYARTAFVDAQGKVKIASRRVSAACPWGAQLMDMPPAPAGTKTVKHLHPIPVGQDACLEGCCTLKKPWMPNA
jgi:hypothetical protein